MSHETTSAPWDADPSADGVVGDARGTPAASPDASGQTTSSPTPPPAAGNDLGELGNVNALYSGDPGTQPDEVRRVLLQLLRGPYVSRQTHAKVWPVLLRHEQTVRSRLADLFVDLVIDDERGVAFTRNIEVDGVEVPRPLRALPLTLVDTALLLHLREALLRSDDPSGRAFVGGDEINDWLVAYRPATSTDLVTFERRVRAAVQKMKDHSMLLGTSEDDRYEISPVLALVFGVDEVAAVTRALRHLDPTVDDESGDEDEVDAPEVSTQPQTPSPNHRVDGDKS